MAKCIRKYYSKEEDRVVTEVWDFTKDNFPDLFRLWLGGDFEPTKIDDELLSKRIVAYMNTYNNVYKEWQKHDGACVWQYFLENEGKEEIGPYVKDSIIFCKMTNKGLPTGLTKNDIDYLTAYISSNEYKAAKIELRDMRDATQDVDTYVLNLRNEVDNDEEFLECLNNELIDNKANLESGIENITAIVDTFSEIINGMIEEFYNGLKDDIYDTFEELKKVCEEGLQNTNESSEVLENLNYYDNLIEQALQHENDEMFLMDAYLKCLKVSELETDKEIYEDLSKLLDGKKEIEKINYLLNDSSFAVQKVQKYIKYTNLSN